ncbi:hypothetical protein [Pseudomonas sp. Au-Pse12]|nr:hypothetical protein [Pseudomonas sp. Au-Pse12]
MRSNTSDPMAGTAYVTGERIYADEALFRPMFAPAWDELEVIDPS